MSDSSCKRDEGMKPGEFLSTKTSTKRQKSFKETVSQTTKSKVKTNY